MKTDSHAETSAKVAVPVGIQGRLQHTIRRRKFTLGLDKTGLSASREASAAYLSGAKALCREKKSGPNPESLTGMLESKKGMIRKKAGESLVALGKPALTSLIKALQRSGSSQVRWEAAKALGAIGDNRSIAPLVKTLEDSDVPNDGRDVAIHEGNVRTDGAGQNEQCADKDGAGADGFHAEKEGIDGEARG